MTGVVNSVSAWLTIRPPTIVKPSGWRNSEPGAVAQHQRHAAEQRRHGRHHDRTEAQERRLADRLGRRQAFLALGGDGEVDHHDAVLLHDADEQDRADEGDEAEFVAEQHERGERAKARRRQRRQDGQRVNETLVEHAEDQIDADQRREDQAAARLSASPGTPARCPGRSSSDRGAIAAAAWRAGSPPWPCRAPHPSQD